MDSMKEQGTPNHRRDVALFAYLEANTRIVCPCGCGMVVMAIRLGVEKG